MLKRLLKRGETSGREDDNEESIKKRFRERFPFHPVSPKQLIFPKGVYKDTTMPVVNHYEKLHKVAEIDSSPSVEEVYQKSATVVRDLLAGKLSGNVTA